MCAGVAVGLGLPAPEATESLPDVEPSPALSQVGQRWPTTGWVIGLIADQSSDLPGVRAVRDAVSAGGMVPLIIAAYGGMLVSGESALSVQRTFLTSRSVEFDAILIAGAPQPAADAAAGLDAKAGDPLVSSGDGRPARHAHACGGLPARQGTRRLGTGGAALAAAGCAAAAPGVVLGQDPSAVLEELLDLLTEHRSGTGSQRPQANRDREQKALEHRSRMATSTTRSQLTRPHPHRGDPAKRTAGTSARPAHAAQPAPLKTSSVATKARSRR